MNTTHIVGIVLAVIVIGGGIWYATTHPISQTQTETENQTATTEPASGAGTIADLWAMTGSVKCDVSSDDPNASFTGTVYASGGKMRVDAVATIAQLDRTVTTHMVRADGFFYTWSDLLPQGIKIAETAAETTAAQQGVSGQTKVNYTCGPWIPDASLLTPPANITFTLAPTAQ